MVGNFSLYAFDLPGHGQSGKAKKPDENYSLKGLGKIVKEIIDALTIKEKLKGLM